MALDLIKNQSLNQILEIGYGSGVFFPELSKRCKRLYGVDTHTKTNLVENMMKKEHIEAELSIGTILNLHYDDDMFDCIICTSVLEHIRNLDRAITEIKRVMRADGVAIIGFPVENKITGTFYASLGFNFKEQHVSTHRMIIKKIREMMKIETLIRWPRFLPLDFSLYVVCKCSKLC